MKGKFKAWMVAVFIIALVGISVAAIAATTVARQPWAVRHSTIIQRVADKFLEEAAVPDKTTSDRILTCSTLRQLQQSDDTAPLVIDMRSKADYDKGHVDEAVWIDDFANMAKSSTLSEIDTLLASHTNKTIVVYCAGGNKSGIIAGVLGVLGYNAKSLVGGYAAWTAPSG